jgi:hypothetical protein
VTGAREGVTCRLAVDRSRHAEVDELEDAVLDVEPKAAIRASTSKLSAGRAARKRRSPARSGDWTSVRNRLSTSTAGAVIASFTAVLSAAVPFCDSPPSLMRRNYAATTTPCAFDSPVPTPCGGCETDGWGQAQRPG